MTPFWEKEYQNKDSSTFGNPCPEVIKILPKLNVDSQILDIACGDGRNSLYLSKLGYNVDAFDFSEKGISKIRALNETHNCNVNCWVQNVEDFIFLKKYDLIMCHGLFQFLDQGIIPKIIEDCKRHTTDNGFNIFAVFNHNSILSQELNIMVKYFFRDNELSEYYPDWKILTDSIYEKDETERYGEKTTLVINKLVALQSLHPNRTLSKDLLQVE